MRDPEYADPSTFAYESARQTFPPGARLTFDENYRLAQLPLVAPGHPLAIEQEAGRDYLNGKYERERFSLVAPVAWEMLASSSAYQQFSEAVTNSSFGPKISAEITRRRSDRLHATISGGLTESAVPRIVEQTGRFLREYGPLRIRVLGPFVGRRNTGRIYLPVIPEMLGGIQAFARLQSGTGLEPGNFYAVGLFSLADELTVAETWELSRLIERWKDVVLLEMSLPRLQVLGTHDDLVLSGRVRAEIQGRDAESAAGGSSSPWRGGPPFAG